MIATDYVVRLMRSTGLGAIHYGNCDQCGKPCSEHFVSQGCHVYLRDDGRRCIWPHDSGAYGHRDCLVGKWGEHIDKSSLQRDGRTLILPDDAPLGQIYPLESS